ncbi:MAG: two-component regulator propeller domain-containing protein [Niastella sp.]|uniref:sensor histidine kinase n=1 Tax=Niastella sp. TaxID=1869183 RepID=UPI00389A34FE
MSIRWFLVLLVSCPQFLFSQEYGYTRYDSKEGLASSTVYCMTQDHDGFMWFGTEAGLTRFDGTHFRTFTIDDGLPDNEVIQLFTDSRGRVWISPFKKSICYYYKGKFHTPENDTLLRHIHVNNYVMRYAENDRGDLLLMEINQLHHVTANNEVYTMNSIQGIPMQNLAAVGRNPAGNFWVIDSIRMYEYSNRLFNLEKKLDYWSYVLYAAVNENIMALRSNYWQNTLHSFKTGKTIIVPATQEQYGFSIIDDHTVSMNSPWGAYVYNINNPDSVQHFLPDIRVTNIKRDKEGNLWFTTMGQGVYRLNSAFVLNTRFKDYNSNQQVLSFARDGNSIAVGSDRNYIHWLNANTGKEERKLRLDTMGITQGVVALFKNSAGHLIGGTPRGILQYTPRVRWFDPIARITVKNLFPYKDDLLVITDHDIFRINQNTLAIKDTIWRERATCAFARNDTFYIGSLNGLYRLLPNGAKQFLGDRFALFRARIAAITRDTNNVLWVATFGGGLVAFRNEKIIAHIKQEQGLAGNICRTLFLEDNNLWVGTNKGLNKIRIDDTTYPLKKYTTGDGLASDIINVVYVYHNKVFVGTPEGVTYFDEGKIAGDSRCDLRFINISVGGDAYYPDLAPVLIPHKKNNIQFDYVGISYKSTGDIRYRYRLLGLDSNWYETRETFLNFPALPSGDYELQLQAINKFDVHSQLLVARFTVEQLLYEKNWFKALAGLLFLAITGLVVLLIVQRIRRKEQEKTAINKRISELEQLSRKAQMNPHFIFNSLNSIQQYVMDADVAGANKFISGFSRLIRQTLDFSSRPEIRLEEELDYLKNYLDIEKTRLEDAFSWVVNMEKGVDPTLYYIPPMILQPFVENSVRHGLRFRKDKNGVVTITVKRDGDYLICILEDNGIGRKAAMQYKSVSPINYQSKGLSLTADRIEMYNREHALKIRMWIDDLEDNFHNSLGTRVTIYFPVL